MNRRSFLRGASAAGLVWVAGCGRLTDGDDRPDPLAESPGGPRSNGTPTARDAGDPDTTRPPGETSGNTPTDTCPRRTDLVDTSVMTDRLVDVSAGDPVSGIVDDIGRGDRLVFPPGRFRWDGEARVTVDDWGIRCHEDTVFEVPPGRGVGAEHKLLATGGGDTADNFLLENLTFDSPGRTAPGMHLGVRNVAAVDGLHYAMDGPRSNGLEENGIRAYVENSDGRLTISDYRQRNNGDLGAYGAGESRVGIFVARINDGTVSLQNPVLQGFPNNACYVSRQPGRVVVDGGLLVNNNVSQVRVSGGVEVRNTTVCIDLERYLEGPGTLEASAHNTRGVWGDSRDAGTAGGLVTDSSFVIRSYRRCTGLATMLENPRMALRNCQFLVDADVEVVRAETGEISVANCDFDGSSFAATAGVGNVTGGNNRVTWLFSPGAVPVTSRNSTFDWCLTHPETPGRSGFLRAVADTAGSDDCR